MPWEQFQWDRMKFSNNDIYRKLYMRTDVFHYDNSKSPWEDTLKIVQDKVLSDQRSAAFAATIIDIKEAPFGKQFWSNCKGCENWYKSQQTILSEARYRFSRF